MLEQDDSREHSDCESEISVPQAEPSCSSANSSTMQGRHLSAEGKTDLNGPGYQELCSSNFVDLDKLSSSLNSCEEFARTSLNSPSVASSHSAESYRTGQNDEGTQKAPLLHKKNPISKLREFSDCSAQWVSNGSAGEA